MNEPRILMALMAACLRRAERVLVCMMLVSVVACASAPPKPTPLPAVCTLPTHKGQKHKPELVATETWFSFMLRGYQRDTRLVSDRASTCAGGVLEWTLPPGLSCPVTDPVVSMLPSDPLTKDDLVLAKVSADSYLVWIRARRLKGGEALGPVALVQFATEGTFVRALGVLRTYAGRPRLSLKTIGKDQVLVAEGEVCAAEQTGLACKQAIRLMVRQGTRFVADPFRNADGTCQEPAWLPTRLGEQAPTKKQKRLQTNLDEGKTVFESTVTFQPTHIEVHEKLVEYAPPPEDSEAPPRVLRRAETVRKITAKGGRLTSSGASLRPAP